MGAGLPAATVSAAAPPRVRFPSGRDANDRRGMPLEELFVLALSAAGIEADEVVPLGATFDWARPQALPVVVVPGVGHFFHGQLPLLKSIVVGAWQL